VDGLQRSLRSLLGAEAPGACTQGAGAAPSWALPTNKWNPCAEQQTRTVWGGQGMHKDPTKPKRPGDLQPNGSSRNLQN
jgi:hypothetical protein